MKLWLPALLCLAHSVNAATVGEMNAAFGAPIWSDETLWNDPDDGVAGQMKWPRESRTSRDSCYRLRPGEMVRFLGARPYSAALHGEGGKVAQISILFANKGTDTARTKRELKKEVEADAKAICDKLTSLLGPPKPELLVQGRQTREQAKRWDWQGHTILVSAPRDEYVVLRILPPEEVNGTARSRVTANDLKSQMLKRVEHFPNGDVLIRDIPMPDRSSPDDLSAPWEAAMRYMGVPSDRAILEMGGDAPSPASGIANGAKEIILGHGRRVDTLSAKIDVDLVARYVDKGIPLVWPGYIVGTLNDQIAQRVRERKVAADMKAWNERLSPARKAARKVEVDRLVTGCSLIVGYNKTTGEIAIADTPDVRWITAEEANAISQGLLMAITF